MRIAFLRHGPTQWNAEGRIQGRIDTPLSAMGRVMMARLRVPADFAAARAFTSPLARARDTAALMGFPDAVPDARLAEHHWGEWEGMTRDEILARDGADAFAKAGAAKDFTPKGGEPTRELLARVESFLREVGKDERPAVTFTHRGILRTAFTLAAGWDMATPMPERLELSKALILDVGADGAMRVAEMNVPLPSR